MREEIVSALVEKSVYAERKAQLEDRIKKLVSFAAENYFPLEIMKLFRNPMYSKYFNHSSVSLKYGDSWGERVFLPNSYPSTINDIMFVMEEITPEAHKEVKELIEELSNVNAEKIVFTNKLKCAMNTYSSSAQLKKDFPEAYEEFCRIEGVSTRSTNCDNVEEVRAILSQKNK